MDNKNNNVVKRDFLKYEIAAELGLLDKLIEQGWGGLSAQETGKIGGLLAQRLNHDSCDNSNLPESKRLKK